ncbi:hypothetical protein LTR10_000176 [Elasticomyces elasticus]|nr:hypothetical protein LTR10_000176 [Elasticomyces elasticus]KAK4980565.1 hypothetical protein LTR42_000873 [Elasticomyces elasticus]
MYANDITEPPSTEDADAAESENIYNIQGIARSWFKPLPGVDGEPEIFEWRNELKGRHIEGATQSGGGTRGTGDCEEQSSRPSQNARRKHGRGRAGNDTVDKHYRQGRKSRSKHNGNAGVARGLTSEDQDDEEMRPLKSDLLLTTFAGNKACLHTTSRRPSLHSEQLNEQNNSDGAQEDLYTSSRHPSLYNEPRNEQAVAATHTVSPILPGSEKIDVDIHHGGNDSEEATSTAGRQTNAPAPRTNTNTAPEPADSDEEADLMDQLEERKLKSESIELRRKMREDELRDELEQRQLKLESIGLRSKLRAVQKRKRAAVPTSQ